MISQSNTTGFKTFPLYRRNKLSGCGIIMVGHYCIGQSNINGIFSYVWSGWGLIAVGVVSLLLLLKRPQKR
jgi:hypothetical protein